MFLALGQLLDIMTVYEDTPSLRMLLGAIATEPLVDVVVAAGLTWAAHSSVAVVLFIMSLAARGAVPPDAAFALVLGANIGAAINPVLEGPAGDDPAAKRLPVGNLLTRVTGAAVALALLSPIGRFMVTAFPDNARAVVNFHTLFNLAVAAVFFPILPFYARLLQRLLPRREDPADPAKPLYLDEAARETPIVALGGAAREALRLVDLVQDMIVATQAAIEKADRRSAVEARRRDDPIDRLASAIKAYLVSLDTDALNSEDQRRLGEIATFVSEIEQAGDSLSRNFLSSLAKKLKGGIALDPSGAGRDPVDDRSALPQSPDGGVAVHDRRCARGASAGRREGRLSRRRIAGRAGAFERHRLRIRLRRPGERVAPRIDARPQTGQQSHRGGVGLSLAGAHGRIAAEPPSGQRALSGSHS